MLLAESKLVKNRGRRPPVISGPVPAPYSAARCRRIANRFSGPLPAPFSSNVTGGVNYDEYEEATTFTPGRRRRLDFCPARDVDRGVQPGLRCLPGGCRQACSAGPLLAVLIQI